MKAEALSHRITRATSPAGSSSRQAGVARRVGNRVIPGAEASLSWAESGGRCEEPAPSSLAGLSQHSGAARVWRPRVLPLLRPVLLGASSKPRGVSGLQSPHLGNGDKYPASEDGVCSLGEPLALEGHLMGTVHPRPPPWDN